MPRPQRPQQVNHVSLLCVQNCIGGASLREYWPFRDELTMDENHIYIGRATIVTLPSLPYVLKHLHDTHQGVVKMLLRARDSIYWPGLRSSLTSIVDECEECHRNSRSQWKPAHKPHELATRPWPPISSSSMVDCT